MPLVDSLHQLPHRINFVIISEYNYDHYDDAIWTQLWTK